MLIPDTAHGTNPATVTMAGYEVGQALATDERGGVDLDDLRAKADDADVACLMLTNPNTLGLFDANIAEIAEIVHEAGATLYYDGANLNAIMGYSRPGDMGFDIVHLNLHKTFSTSRTAAAAPAPGRSRSPTSIAPFLPVPRVVRGEGDDGDGAASTSSTTSPASIGRLRGFQGNFGVLVRAYAYIAQPRRATACARPPRPRC